MKTECSCRHHRHAVVHLVEGVERVFDHGRATFEAALQGVRRMETVPSRFYRHGMKASDVREAIRITAAVRALERRGLL